MEKGVPASTSMPGGTRAPEVQTHFKVGSVVLKPRATKSGLTANFGTVIRVKGTMWLYLHGQLSDLESCVAV